MTQISPMLAVRGGREAIEFYKSAFGAVEKWRIDAGDNVIAGLEIDGAEFFLADETPDRGTRGPSSIDATTVRIELFVDEPAAMLDRAVAAGARLHSPVAEHQHTTAAGWAFQMLQGSVTDPFGHIWLIGKFLEA